MVMTTKIRRIQKSDSPNFVINKPSDLIAYNRSFNRGFLRS